MEGAVFLDFSETITLKGKIKKKLYQSPDKRYSVFVLSSDGDDETLTGFMPDLSEGDSIEAVGRYTDHPRFGIQFKVSSYKIEPPADSKAMEEYLGSGAIQGVGEKMAARIVAKFGDDTFRIIEEEPERLAEIKGISKRKAVEIAVSMEKKKDMREAMVTMAGLGISQNMAVRIYETYGPSVLNVFRTNPYKLAEDVRGIGFKTADSLAMQLGVNPDSEERCMSAIIYVLSAFSQDGHCYALRDVLTRETEKILGDVHADTVKCLDEMIYAGKLKRDGEKIYLPAYYFAELSCARMLTEKNVSLAPELSGLDTRIEKEIIRIAEEKGYETDELQINAVKECIKNGLFILTGGPGTGKTTTINIIINYFIDQGCDIVLAAPTGRAAKRMTEATGYEATTIHRLLGVVAMSDDAGATQVFQKNADEPIEADVIIIDEMSMVDILLFKSLLSAVPASARLILVGDPCQLPSVGPGNVLSDICSCDFFPIVKLEKIFRQDESSNIVINAHKIQAGEHIELKSTTKDFIFVEKDDADSICQIATWMIMEKLPTYVNCDVMDIQVLTPMRVGNMGAEHLNSILQARLNPPSDDKKEYLFRDTVFREGDKVMQTKNDYKLEWRTDAKLSSLSETGTGVFNGDLGRIRRINESARVITVCFDDGRVADYPFSELEELDLSYAMTIHKSQGSEYPAVIIPVLDVSQPLVYRNLLYTGITRAKTCVILLGSSKLIYRMIDTKGSNDRNSSLKERLIEANNR